jgi:hypothetical protein
VADRRTAAEAAALASMRRPMRIHSRATNGRTAPTRQGKVLRPDRGIPFQGRIARNRPQTGAGLPGTSEIAIICLKFGVHPGNVGFNSASHDDGCSHQKPYLPRDQAGGHGDHLINFGKMFRVFLWNPLRERQILNTAEAP